MTNRRAWSLRNFQVQRSTTRALKLSLRLGLHISKKAVLVFRSTQHVLHYFAIARITPLFKDNIHVSCSDCCPPTVTKISLFSWCLC
ncbi:hypothetical protein Y032_0019g3823 [Ancylostoma ceylanicum]|uniref:Uncharacterized protein n=1 Tax=Ancylostoma ceylanicum TaxID=53326 RepID=A0A016V346_9BILA|nr:hypothetical protein Y032_0019g3823 [Ancylostoma ceylanicum]